MRKFQILLVIVLIMGAVYFVFDRHLFYYGKNNFNFYNSLPLELKPIFNYDIKGEFAIEDKHGFYLVSWGKHQYVGSEKEIIVQEIIRYGFTDEKLIAQIADTAGSNYYIEFSSNTNPQSKQGIIVSVWGEAEKPTLEDFRWIKIKGNEKVEMIELFRFVSLVVFILSVLFLIFKIFKLLINRAQKALV